MNNYEVEARTEVCGRLGRELPDSVWAPAYEQAKNKLRHIVSLYGDDGGERNSVYYIAQLTIEALQAAALTEYLLGKSEEAARKDSPQRTTGDGIRRPGTYQDVRPHGGTDHRPSAMRTGLVVTSLHQNRQQSQVFSIGG